MDTLSELFVAWDNVLAETENKVTQLGRYREERQRLETHETYEDLILGVLERIAVPSNLNHPASASELLVERGWYVRKGSCYNSAD